ncbi:hypothetical protein PI124_g13062 [Phytophthora idaei]|nr:hypothetical protein PI125_g6314 [Phytophthora idaei]KAG3150326.1 hypothetical protein PI126_g11557 [Phytophthora idaei]KAG3242084.1 hypothetical protein PI124_g13062 [Phytophthora idaei]
MEISRIVHDELLHQVDGSQEEHLIALRRASVSPRPGTPSDNKLSGEHTPLLPAVDKVDVILDEEEKAAVAVDNKLTAWEIVSVETNRLLAVAFPMMLALMLEMFPDLALSNMIGHTDVARSTEILAAYQLSSLVQMMIIGGLIMGLSSAIDTMCSHAFGAKKMVELWRITQAATIVYLMCLPFITLVLCSGKPMLVAMGQDPAISDVAGQLLLVSMLLVAFCIMYAIMKSALQAQNIVFPFVLASLVSFILSSIAAYVLAFHSSLGYIGVALGSPVGWFLKVVMVLPVVLRNRVFVESWPGWDWSEAWARVPGIGRLGVSSVLMMTFQMVGFSFISLLAGMLPNADVLIAANGIFVSVICLAFMPLLGICIAGAIRMGNALGAGQARRARLISFLVMSVFRACGKQLLCAQLNFVCLFVLGVPLGLVFAIQFDAGIAGLWAGNMAGNVIFAVAGIFWLRATSWEKMAHDAKHGTRHAGIDVAMAA